MDYPDISLNEEPVNILIVDDMEMNLRALEMILESPEYRLVRAMSGTQALKRLSETGFAMVLLDVKMPEMDGFETAKQIRKDREHKDLPIIFVTGEFQEPEHIALGYSLKAVDYIIKPLDKTNLRMRVGLLAELYRSRNRLKRQSEMLMASETQLKHLVSLRNEELRALEIEVTERKRVEALLEVRNRELENINKELSDFAYVISHDLREPLRGIYNYSKYLMEEFQDRFTKDGVYMLSTLCSLSERLDRQINAVLNYSRLGRSAFSLEKTDMNQVVKDVLSSLSYTVEEQKVKIDISAPLPHERCDPCRAFEVFQNLIVNAIKFNDKQEKKIEIGSIVNDKNPTVFFVKDNGIGMDPKYIHGIYRMFSQLNPKEAYEGTGAGLCFVKRIVELHGGEIWARSEPGRGSTFYFTLAKHE